jgi:hypothetical protein
VPPVKCRAASENHIDQSRKQASRLLRRNHRLN